MTSHDNLFARMTHLIGANSTAGKVDKKGGKEIYNSHKNNLVLYNFSLI